MKRITLAYAASGTSIIWLPAVCLFASLDGWDDPAIFATFIVGVQAATMHVLVFTHLSFTHLRLKNVTREIEELREKLHILSSRRRQLVAALTRLQQQLHQPVRPDR